MRKARPVAGQLEPICQLAEAGRPELGLALVGKLVGDHGGVIDYDTSIQGTAFRVMLPMLKEHI